MRDMPQIHRLEAYVDGQLIWADTYNDAGAAAKTYIEFAEAGGAQLEMKSFDLPIGHEDTIGKITCGQAGSEAYRPEQVYTYD